MAHLSLVLLGSLQIQLDGAPITALESDKVRALLAYLALEADRPHRRAALAGLLWPDRPERAAHLSLNQALSNLRQAIGDRIVPVPVLRITPETIQFNHASDHRIDVVAYTELLTTCDKHLHRHSAMCRSCAQRRQQAIDLYQGDFLAGFFLRDCAAFEEWVLLQRERLHHRARAALTQLADYHERRGAYAQAQQCARRQLELDPWREESHRQLMRVLALSGQRSAALVQYATCRRVLAAELGVEPEEETTALSERIKHGAVLMDAQPGRAPSNLAAHTPPTPLIGRETELAQLADHLEDRRCRLLTLVGTGGIGKTRLALQAAADVGVSFPDSVAFVALAPLRSAEFVVPAIAGALGFVFHGAGDAKTQLLAYLSAKDMLLVLDNFEHLLVVAPLVSELLAACPNLAVLATSRAPLHVRGEQQFPVPSLTLPPTDDRQPTTDDKHSVVVDRRSSVVTQYAGVQLFIQRAQAVQPNFAVTAANAPDVAAICIRLDGLPLAIELAAARVKLFAPAALLRGLSSRLTLLTGGARDLPARQQTIRATIDWSYNLLSEAEQRLFHRLGVFVGGCMLEAVEAVCNGNDDLPNEVVDRIATLVNQSLLRQVEEPGGAVRFMMLETIREYALERLEASGEAEQLRRRHAGYFETFSSGQPAGDDEAWLRRVKPDYDNLRSALEWSQTPAGDPETALWIVSALSSLWLDRGIRHEGIAMLQRTLDHSLSVDRTLAFAHARVELGHLLAMIGNYRAAQAQYEQALPLVYEQGDLELHIYLLNSLGRIAREQGDSATAWARLTESLVRFRELDHAGNIAETLNTLGEVAILDEDPARAEALLAESRAIEQQEPAAPKTVGWRLNHLGHAAQLRGEYQRAAELHQESLAIFRSMGDRHFGLPSAYHGLGETALGQGRLDEAARWLAQGLALSQILDDRASLSWCLAGLGSAAALDMNPERAARLWGAAAHLRRVIGCRPPPAARATYERAIALARAQLGEAAFAAVWTEGRGMTLEQVIAEALRAVP